MRKSVPLGFIVRWIPIFKQLPASGVSSHFLNNQQTKWCWPLIEIARFGKKHYKTWSRTNVVTPEQIIGTGVTIE